jgi:hypothetical protein
VAAEQLQVGDAFADDDYAWLVVGEPVEVAAGVLLVLVASRPGRKPATSSRPTSESAAGSPTDHNSAQTEHRLDSCRAASPHTHPPGCRATWPVRWSSS